MNGQAIWLYGSVARGDWQIDSDADILVVGEGSIPGKISAIFPDLHTSVSQYSWSEMQRMADYGSVFLHHLRDEARPLIDNPVADKRLRDLLVEVGRYTRASSDLAAFHSTLRDVRDALRRDCSTAYELSVLGSVARHASVLACFLAGGPYFGRRAAFRRLKEILQLSQDPEPNLTRIYRFRIAEERGLPIPYDPQRAEVSEGLQLLQVIVDRMEVLALDYTQSVSAGA